ncbi:MAG: twin-arginine translocase subunit TatB [Gammaproteobacteria bacterium]|nr:twin-arginine translocase subunit TatB [Gammaproteobacteria bacterium]
MFDVGFWEIGLIAIVALLVIGPERLPAVARTVGFWLGKVRRFVSSVQSDFNREVMKTEELKELLEGQAKIKEVHEMLEQSLDSVSNNVSVKANLFKNDQAVEDDTSPETKSINTKTEQGNDTPVIEPEQATSTRHNSPAESVNDKTK